MPTDLVTGISSDDYKPYHVNSSFAEWRDLDGDGRKEDQHNGLDLRARKPATVTSATNGTVVYAGETTSMGNLVVIQSNVTAPNGNLLNIRYMHLSQYGVSTSQSILAGAYLGKTGSTGGVAPHFHMDVNAFRITTSKVSGGNEPGRQGQNPAAFFTSIPWVNKVPYGKAYSGYVD